MTVSRDGGRGDDGVESVAGSTGGFGRTGGRSAGTAAGTARDRVHAMYLRRVRATLDESVALHARAAKAIACAAATVSATASRHGGRLRTHGVVRDAQVNPGSERTKPFSRVFTIAGVPPVRRLIADVARRVGLPGPGQSDFVLVAQELMTNAVRHGGGWGRVRVYRDGDVLVCTVTDRGPGLAGDGAEAGVVPVPDAEGGRGFFLVRQLADTMHMSPARPA